MQVGSGDTNPPIAEISDPAYKTNVFSGVQWLDYPVIRDGLFNLKGRAYDANAPFYSYNVTGRIKTSHLWAESTQPPHFCN